MTSPLRVVIASPGDVQAERDLMPRVIEELNQGIGKAKQVRLELSRWETDSGPGFHPLGPQGLVDQALKIEECDLLIGIFWKKFGTPVSDARSGTEHEFLTAYRAWQTNRGKPQILVYFKEQKAWPKSDEEIAQWQKVLEFKKNFPKEGMWWPFKRKAEFETLVRQHLTQFVLGLATTAVDEPARPLPPSSPSSPSAPPAQPPGTASAPSASPASGTTPAARPPHEDELRRMQVRAIVLERRLNDLRDRRDRGRIDEGRYQDLVADLEREHVQILLDAQKLLTDQDREIADVLSEAVNGGDQNALGQRLAAALEKRHLAPSLVQQLKQHRGFLASSLIEASLIARGG